MRTYTVTAADVLWLSRAVEAEGAVQFQVAQVLVNCFCQRASTAKVWPGLTLTDHVRQYAQPVNPRWFLSGDLHQKWAAKGQDTPAAARRRETVHSTLSRFSLGTAEAVKRALTKGPVDILPNATDYAASWIDASKKYRPLTEARKGVNRIWTRDPLWGAYTVLT